MIERTYIENGINITVFKKIGKPLRLSGLGHCSFIEIDEIPTENLGKSWKRLNDESKQAKALDEKPIKDK